MPRIGGADHFWLNGLYEAVCIVLLFPAIVYIDASGKVHDALLTFSGAIILAYLSLTLYDEPGWCLLKVYRITGCHIRPFHFPSVRIQRYIDLFP